MPTLTPNYNLYKPLVNNPTDQDLWGGYLNSNFDFLDTQLLVATNDITRSISANTTLTSADQNKLILVDASGGDVTVTLPSSSDGFRVGIKKVDSSSNNVTIDGAGSETIDGSLTKVLSEQYSFLSVVGDSSNWSIITESSADDVLLIANNLSDVADAATSLSNLGGVASSFFTSNQSLAVNGYQKLPGNLLLQWGSKTGAASSGTVNFPTSFSTAVYSVVATLSSNDGNEGVVITSTSTSSFNFFANEAITFYWVAIGV